MAEADGIEDGATLRGFIEGQRVFSRYRLERILGRGGMGVVWLGFDEELERKVALKFVPELVCLDKEAIADLKRETRRSLEITHPNIVRIYDFHQDAHTAAISMEYIDGTTLSALKTDRKGCVDVAELKPIVKQLCEALDYAHGRAKVVHRDLKPANLMTTREGELKITDFGISCSISDSVSRVSLARGTSGTVVFMSPQQALGERPTAADDIYALGATIYDLVAGKPPFYRGDVMTQLRESAPAPMAARREELGLKGGAIPEVWESVVRSCLSKAPGDRPASAGAVAATLGLIPAAAPLGRERGTSPAIEATVPDAMHTRQSEAGAAIPPRVRQERKVDPAGVAMSARFTKAAPPKLAARAGVAVGAGEVTSVAEAPGDDSAAGTGVAGRRGLRRFLVPLVGGVWGLAWVDPGHGGASTAFDILLLLGPMVAFGLIHSMFENFGRMGFLYAAGAGVLAFGSACAEGERLKTGSAESESLAVGVAVFFLCLFLFGVMPFLRKRREAAWARSLMMFVQGVALLAAVLAGAILLIGLMAKCQEGL